jgi:drug/metabolite transporter (DMT)-like permease
MKPRSVGLLELHAAVLLFGLAGLFGKFLALPAWTIVFGRSAFAALALGVIWRLSPERHARVFSDRREAGLMAAQGVLLAFHWWTFFRAIQVSTVAVGLLSYSSFPLFVTFLEPLFFRERLRGLDVFSAALVFIGLGLMVPAFDFSDQVTQGIGWGVLSGLSFALLSLLNRRMVRVHPPLVIAAYQNLVAALVLSPLLRQWPAGLGVREVIWLAVLGVFCTALSHTLFIRSLAQVRAQLASVVAGLEAVYGGVFGFLFLREVPTTRTLLGGGIILGATVFATLKRPHRQDAAR